MSKIMVLTAVHDVGGERGPICQFFSKRMEAVREATGIETLIVGSEGGVSENVALQGGHVYVDAPNKPLTHKFNAGMAALREHGPSHVMILGSDDICSTSLFEAYQSMLLQCDHDILGVTDLYLMGLRKNSSWCGVSGYWRGYKSQAMLGVGRMVSARLLEAMDWSPWYGTRNSGMDGIMTKSMSLVKDGIDIVSQKLSIAKHGHMILDIKTKKNISSMSSYALENIDWRCLLRTHLPYQEAGAIIDYGDKIIQNYGK